METLSTLGPRSIEQQLNDLEVGELFDYATYINHRLAELGITTPISVITYGATSYGHLYEDKRFDSGNAVPTGLNCLMSLLHHELKVTKLSQAELLSLGRTLGRLSLVTMALVNKITAFTWPTEFTNKPVLKPKIEG